MEFSQDGQAAVAVDLLVFTIDDDRLKVLTVRRQYEPFAGMRALPGVFIRPDESLDEAARRGLREETGLEGIYFEQLYTWGAPDRDPRRRVLSVSYMALVDIAQLRGAAAGLRTTETRLWDVQELLSADDIASTTKRSSPTAGSGWRTRSNIRPSPSPWCRRSSPCPSSSGSTRSCWENPCTRPISERSSPPWWRKRTAPPPATPTGPANSTGSAHRNDHVMTHHDEQKLYRSPFVSF